MKPRDEFEGVIDFYETIVDCPNNVVNCPNILRDETKGNSPRGFYTEGKPEDIKLLLVAKNPGHPLSEENVLYQGLSNHDFVLKHLNFVNRKIYGQTYNKADKRSLTFHKNLLRYMKYFLDIPESQVFQICAYTNLVKCSSVGERDRLLFETANKCFNRHLCREIMFFNPKVIIAFGREVYNFLSRKEIKSSHLKPIVYVKHPSYYYRKDKEEEILAKKKAQILGYLQSNK